MSDIYMSDSVTYRRMTSQVSPTRQDEDMSENEVEEIFAFTPPKSQSQVEPIKKTKNLEADQRRKR